MEYKDWLKYCTPFLIFFGIGICPLLGSVIFTDYSNTICDFFVRNIDDPFLSVFYRLMALNVMMSVWIVLCVACYFLSYIYALHSGKFEENLSVMKKIMIVVLNVIATAVISLFFNLDRLESLSTVFIWIAIMAAVGWLSYLIFRVLKIRPNGCVLWFGLSMFIWGICIGLVSSGSFNFSYFEYTPLFVQDRSVIASEAYETYVGTVNRLPQSSSYYSHGILKGSAVYQSDNITFVGPSLELDSDTDYILSYLPYTNIIIDVQDVKASSEDLDDNSAEVFSKSDFNNILATIYETREELSEVTDIEVRDHSIPGAPYKYGQIDYHLFFTAYGYGFSRENINSILLGEEPLYDYTLELTTFTQSTGWTFMRHEEGYNVIHYSSLTSDTPFSYYGRTFAGGSFEEICDHFDVYEQLIESEIEPHNTRAIVLTSLYPLFINNLCLLFSDGNVEYLVPIEDINHVAPDGYGSEYAYVDEFVEIRMEAGQVYLISDWYPVVKDLLALFDKLDERKASGASPQF